MVGQYGRGMAAKPYGDVNPYVLKALPNPGGAIELKHKAPEVTFLGAQDQPDFGTLYVTFYPGENVIELKSLKEYGRRCGRGPFPDSTRPPLDARGTLRRIGYLALRTPAACPCTA